MSDPRHFDYRLRQLESRLQQQSTRHFELFKLVMGALLTAALVALVNWLTH